jgi:hypothetical protein
MLASLRTGNRYRHSPILVDAGCERPEMLFDLILFLFILYILWRIFG